jgi:hypothetical protein
MMANAGVNKDSDKILHLIKSGTIGAEIGVWKGSSSEKFLKKGLKKFYMVDAWSLSGYDEAFQVNDPTISLTNIYNKYQKIVGSKHPADFQEYYDKIYNGVVSKFSSYKEAEIIRKPATQWFEEYKKAGEKLDWIYIDGDHSYTGVKNDLNNAIEVVKPGGLIIGDDYKWKSLTADKGGVKKAVNEFVSQRGLNLSAHGSVQWSIKLP